jgi:ABC-2 type transport system ATP-binding protein
MEKDLAIKAENVSKTFRIPHEKISSLRGAFVSAFRSHGYEEFKALDDVSFEVKKRGVFRDHRAQWHEQFISPL